MKIQKLISDVYLDVNFFLEIFVQEVQDVNLYTDIVENIVDYLQNL
jgi:hypothetical protein